MYRKNLWAWERWSCLVVAGAGIGAALLVPMSIWLENAIIPAAAGLVAIVIGGYRPACALVARKPAGSR